MKLVRSFVAIMAIAAVGACGDDDDDGTGPGASLEGSYTVSGFTYTPDAGGSGVNLALLPSSVGCPCGILSMDVDANNNFSGQLRFPGEPTATIGGHLDVDGNNITVDFNQATEDATGLEDEPGTFTLTSSGGLTITLTEVTFDYSPFGGPAGETPSTLVIVGAQID